jgi:hypothetical protein
VSKIFESCKVIAKFLFSPAPSRLVFYALVAADMWLVFQVMIQGYIIKAQMEDINWLMSLLRTAVFTRR